MPWSTVGAPGFRPTSHRLPGVRRWLPRALRTGPPGSPSRQVWLRT
jgi:hypothetical protein